MKRLAASIAVLVAMTACSTAAELDRPEDTVLIRASYTTAAPVVKWVTGGTDVCQLTALEAGGALLADYSVILDREDGCTIMPKDVEP